VGVTIGLQVVPQHGDMAPMRDAWMEAEALGVDRLYSADHFHAMVLTTSVTNGEHAAVPPSAKNFESTTIQAAMAVTTTRPEIGCVVQANSYRNPNLMADIARTIDHLSGGRYILGMGSGYLKPDYDEYGYEYGTQTSRLNDLARDLPIIKSRFEKLNPPPLRKIPLMIASAGEKIGLRIVAEHADIWNVYGPIEKMLQKREVLEQHCRDIGRDPAEIEYTTFFFPDLLPDVDLDKYVAMGMKHIIAIAAGPKWDLGQLRELLAWRKSLG
jgi:probable F420-dependent oxidoreductase